MAGSRGYTRSELFDALKARFGRASGFTLIELSIVVFILATVLAVATPYFVRSFNYSIVNHTARTLSTTGQYARLQAVVAQAPAVLHLDLGRQLFWVSQNLRDETGELREFTLKITELSSRVRLISAEGAEGVPQREGLIESMFYPNGSCDPLKVVIQGPSRADAVEVGFDPVTAQATVTSLQP